MAVGVELHARGHEAVHAEVIGGNAGDFVEGGRDEQGHAALLIATAHLRHGVLAVARGEHLVVEAAHDATRVLEVVAAKIAEDELAGLVLAVRKV